MTDDRKHRSGEDSTSINVHQSYEVHYWAGRFHVSPDRIRRAVEKVGVRVTAVAYELTGKTQH